MFYSKSTNGFYDSEIHSYMPNDAVEITVDEHLALLEGQSKGKKITSDDNGKPILADPPAPTIEEIAVAKRAKRDDLLNGTQWLVQRHRDQIEVAEPTTLTADQYKALLTYRQALRDVTNQTGFPNDVVWPPCPL